MNCSDEKDIFHECAATSETDTARNLELTPPSFSSFTDLKIDLAQDGSPRKQTTTLSTSYSNLSTRYNFTFFDGTTPRIARPRDSPPSSISANHMTDPLSQTKPLSTPPTANPPQTKIPNSQRPTTPDQIADPSYESKFGLITPPPTPPATSELASPKSTTESGPNLAPLTPPQTPPGHKSTPPTRELSNCFFSCVKTKSKSTPQPSQLKPTTPTPKHRGFQVVQYSPSPTISYEVEAGTKYGLGKKRRELSALEMSREKRKIMIRKLSYGMKAELKDIVRRVSLADKKMQVQKEVERGYGLGIWKGEDGDADEEKVVDSTLERMNLWFAQSRIC